MAPYQHILHPTDLCGHSRAAFLHALRLAVGALGGGEGAELEVLHCDPERREAGLERFPKARQFLNSWGVLRQGNSLQSLGLTIRHQLNPGNPGREIVRVSSDHQVDLLVMATRSRKAWSEVLQNSVSSQVLHGSHLPGLLLPACEEGFVESRSGQVSLQRVLLPVAPDPDPGQARLHAVRFLGTLGRAVQAGGELLQVYVGKKEDFPSVACPAAPVGWKWRHRILEGQPVQVIAELAATWKPQLVVMASKGRDSWKDHWFGSTLDQLIDRLHCPILVVPAG